MLRQLRHNLFYDFIDCVYIKRLMIDYYNNTNAIGAYLVKVIDCVTFVVNLRYERMNIAFDERPKRFGGVL